ncbi:MAG TPA: hypothetical protein VNZ57_08245 [Longimicrobiales bacterium]|nr:hypothetical protein [Longimicrobiales bacterium]
MKRLHWLVVGVAVALAGCQEIVAPTTNTDLPATPMVTVPGGLTPLFAVESESAYCGATLGGGAGTPPGGLGGPFMLAAEVIGHVGSPVPPYDLSAGSLPSHALGVNDSDVFVGFATIAGRKRAVMRGPSDADWTQLPVAADSSVAYRINNQGQVVGVQWTGNQARAFLYSGGSSTPLPIPAGYDQVSAFDINNSGQVVGHVVRNAPFRADGFLWTPDVPNGTTGTFTIIGSGVGAYTAAYGINDRGDVVGEIGDYTPVGQPGARGAFVWLVDHPNGNTGTFTNIGMPPGTYMAEARDINDRGEVVGNAVVGTQVTGAGGTKRYPTLGWYWNAGEGFTILPAPTGGANGGGATSYAHGINENGVVVGRVATEGKFFEQRTFLWDPAVGVMELHGKLSGSCSSAGYDVNLCNTIAGWSLQPGTDYTIATGWGGCAPQIEITLEKSAQADTVYAGDPIAFELVVTNNSSVVVDEVVLTDPLPSGLGVEWTVAEPGCTISGTAPQMLVCDFGVLAAGASRTVIVQSQTVAQSCGTYTNVATAHALGVDPVTAEASIVVECGPPLPDVCDGGITKIVLKYIGTQPLTGEVRGQRVAPGSGQRPILPAQTTGVGANTLYTFAIIPLGGLFEPVANGRLANDFAIFIGNSEVARVHTSCSQPIYRGMIIGGLFELVDMANVNGANAAGESGSVSTGSGGDGNGTGQGNNGNKGNNGNGNGNGNGKGNGNGNNANSGNGGNGTSGSGNGGGASPAPSLATFTMGGWGSSPAGQNPGRLLHDNFSRVFPSGVVIGGTRQIRFTNAGAITDFLPTGGSPAALKKDHNNPKKNTEAGVFAGQVLALQLNVSFSAAGVTGTGLGAMRVKSGPLAGKTVSEVLSIANSVLGGGALPSGIQNVSQLNDVVDAINNAFSDGHNSDYLVP